MKKILIILSLPLFIFHSDIIGQRSKNKKNKSGSGPRIMEVIGDSLRTDSVVVYETEIGYIMPDLSEKFKGRWTINVMRRQARAIPDSLAESYIEFNEDTVFNAFVGCNRLRGKYTIKGPTIKFMVLDSGSTFCSSETQQWFIKLIQERVSYFGIDEKILYLKDVANNIVFDCARKPEE